MSAGRLTVAKVRQLNEPGRYADGGCLYLVVAPGGSKHWVARLTIHGRQTDMGLGGLSIVSLADARDEAARLRKIARTGGDPRLERKREQLTFAGAAKHVHEGLLPTWKNTKHAETWIASLERHAFPVVGDRRIETLTSADCLSVLSPIWTTRHETAKRLKQRMSAVFDWAKGAGHYPHENPVNGLKMALPAVKRRPEYMAAMDWRDIPEFMAELGKREAVSARTLEFIILTAARSGEARGALWSEIDGNLWRIPPHRMKRGLSHVVPLSPQSLNVLARVRGLDEEIVFPAGTRKSGGGAKKQSNMVFKSLVKRMNREGFTIHGFRSSFRDWCAENAPGSRELAELSLSHAVGDATERSYWRTDLLEARRTLMVDWANFVCSIT